MCLAFSFLLLLTTQAQLHRTVDSMWTADEKVRWHIPRLLSPQLISKNGLLSFLFKHLVWGDNTERKWGKERERKGGDAESGRGERFRERGTEREERHLSSAGLF